MASAQVRRAFRYPAEDDEHVELDEEEQEKLIADLQQHDEDYTNIYRISFTAIPILAAVYYLYALITASSATERLTAVLSITSLGSSAYLFIRTPPETPDRKGKKSLYLIEQEKSPIDRYLLLLSAALTIVLLLQAVLSVRRSSTDQATKQALPAAIFGMLLFAKQQLRPLEWQELHQHRYELKGA